MAKSPAIGLCTCPDCGYEKCEIKRDKNGDAYRFCPADDCNLQTFTRDPIKSARMIAKMKPISEVSAPPAIQKTENIPKPQKPTENAPTALKSGLLMD